MDDADSPDTCGLGIRGVSMAIDSGVWFVFLFVAIYPVAAATGQLETTAEGVNASLEGTPATVALGLWLALGIGYHTLAEWRYGKTIGKYLVSIRVVGDDGAAPSLRASLVRNALRLVDWLPLFYLVGIVALLLSDRDRRLGDRVGDTLVVRE
ncbi:MAG: RDD family protein [Halobacteriaceae archaeon]